MWTTGLRLVLTQSHVQVSDFGIYFWSCDKLVNRKTHRHWSWVLTLCGIPITTHLQSWIFSPQWCTNIKKSGVFWKQLQTSWCHGWFFPHPKNHLNHLIVHVKKMSAIAMVRSSGRRPWKRPSATVDRGPESSPSWPGIQRLMFQGTSPQNMF